MLIDINQVAKKLCISTNPTETKKNTKRKSRNRRYKRYKFVCHSCQKEFTNKQNLTFHVREKHIDLQEKEYECTKCDYTSNYGSNYRRHLLKHVIDLTNLKPFKCENCDQSFAQQAYLNQHIQRTHPRKRSDVKNFECAICSKKFSVETNLKIHIKRLHLKDQDEKRYKCTNCHFSTHYGSAYKRHLALHDNSISFKCDICGTNYTTKANLQSHIKIKHISDGKKDYCCTKCDFQTFYKKSLEKHTATVHDGIKQFQCPVCMKRFTNKKAHRLHVDKNKCTPNVKKEELIS